LTRVLAAPPQTDDEIRILALEIYEDGFIVRHVLPSGPTMPASAGEATLNPMGLVSLTLRDDLSTTYEMVGMTSGTHHGFTEFIPAIPPEASWLEIYTKAGAVRFDLERPDRYSRYPRRSPTGQAKLVGRGNACWKSRGAHVHRGAHLQARTRSAGSVGRADRLAGPRQSRPSATALARE
jgi:hypothetical protein